MATRFWPGLGPVFAYEWLTASRRWQGYALRSLLVLLLLFGLSGVWWGSHDGTGELSVQQVAEIGGGFYAVTTLMMLGLVGLPHPRSKGRRTALEAETRARHGPTQIRPDFTWQSTRHARAVRPLIARTASFSAGYRASSEPRAGRPEGIAHDRPAG